MANTVISLKKSATPLSIPVNLANGELAINYADGILYYKAANGTIASIQSLEGNAFGTVNADGTFIVSDTVGDILSIVSGNNIEVVGDAVNDKITIQLKNDVVIPSSGTFKVSAVGNDEGGEIKLGNATTNSVLAGDIIVDVYQNKLRFFESGNPNRGAYINLAAASVGVGTDLLAAATGTDVTARITANAAFLHANAAFDVSNAAFLHANSGYAFANSISITSNLAFAHANAAFSAANNAVTDFSPAFLQANIAYAHANAAFSAANNAVTDFSPAFIQANNAYDRANVTAVELSNTAPMSPTPGKLWWNSSLGRMFIYYVDVDSSQWIEATPGGIKAEDIQNASRNANLAFDQANTARNHANTIYAFSNSAHAIANVAFNHANGIYNFANSAHKIANLAFTHANNAYNEANSVNTYSDVTYVKLTSSSQTITGNLSVVGSLSISGNTYIINTDTLRVSDPLLYLAGNNYTSDIVDIGFIANYVNATGQNVHTGLYREHENKEYYLFQGYDREPINNHIGPMSNNMTLAVLNADLKTSNLVLGGANAILRIDASHNQANAAYDKANSVIESGYYAGNNGEVGRASGLGDIFRVHTNTLTANVTIYSGNNALAAGPITVAPGKVLTIQANARIAIV